MKKNRNLTTELNPAYVRQQDLLKSLCEEFGLVYFTPSYHAQDNDCNTVLIYTKEAHEYNKEIDKEEFPDRNKYKDYICSFENSDVNGHFDYGFMKCRKGSDLPFRIDLRGLKAEETLRNAFIEMNGE